MQHVFSLEPVDTRLRPAASTNDMAECHKGHDHHRCSAGCTQRHGLHSSSCSPQSPAVHAVLCFESDEGRSDSTLTPTSAHKATRTTDPGFDQEDQAHKLQHWLHLHHRQEPGQAAEECASCVGNSAFPCHALQKKKVEKRRLLHFFTRCTFETL